VTASVAAPAPESLTRNVRSHGLLGVALWRDEVQLARWDAPRIRSALADGIAELRRTAATDVARLPVPATGMRRVSWRRTSITQELAAESQLIGEVLARMDFSSARPLDVLNDGLRRAIVVLADRERQLGTPVTEIVREFPRHDPSSGYSDAAYERSLANMWLAMPHSHLTDADCATLQLALASHQRYPERDFSDLVRASEEFGERFKPEHIVRVEEFEVEADDPRVASTVNVASTHSEPPTL
jgi:hypothetical protein